MKVRQATIEDLNEVSMLFDAYRVWYNQPSDIYEARTFIEDRIDNKESVIYLVTDDNDKIVGFTQLYPLFSSTRMKRLWLLNDLFVTPDYRGQGFSKALIEKAKDLCRNTDACALSLETDKTNKIGNQLYKKTGFKLNEHSNFYEWSL